MLLIPYIVRQGDHLTSLAHRFRFAPDDIWNHPKNAELKAKRKNPNILLPGDTLYVPQTEKTWLPLAIGGTNTFVAKVPTVNVALRFVESGKPVANAKYELDGIDLPPGATDSDGGVRLLVPVTVSKFVLRFVDRNESHVVGVGHLDPADEPSGAWARLACLGYLGRAGAVFGTGGKDELAVVLRLFQKKYNLGASGELDEVTVAKLVEQFGS